MRTATTRAISGVVNGNGTINRGDGFTVQRTAGGTYIVTVAPPLRAVAGVASPYTAAVGQTVTMYPNGPNTFAVYTFTAPAAPAADLTFSFVIVGMT